MSEDIEQEIEPLLADGSKPATSDEVIAALDKLGIENSTITHAPMSCLLYTSPSPRDATLSRMPSSA